MTTTCHLIFLFRSHLSPYYLPPQMHSYHQYPRRSAAPLARLRVRGHRRKAPQTCVSPLQPLVSSTNWLNLSSESVRTGIPHRRLDRTCKWLHFPGRGQTPPGSSRRSPAATDSCSIIWQRRFYSNSQTRTKFLLQTFHPVPLERPLCDAVTGQQDGRRCWKAGNGTTCSSVPLDDQRRYRYHHLFADVLRARSMEELTEKILVLHRRASEWYERWFTYRCHPPCPTRRTLNGQRPDRILPAWMKVSSPPPMSNRRCPRKWWMYPAGTALDFAWAF